MRLGHSLSQNATNIFYVPWQGWRGSRAALDQQELGFYRSLASMND